MQLKLLSIFFIICSFRSPAGTVHFITTSNAVVNKNALLSNAISVVPSTTVKTGTAKEVEATLDDLKPSSPTKMTDKMLLMLPRPFTPRLHSMIMTTPPLLGVLSGLLIIPEAIIQVPEPLLTKQNKTTNTSVSNEAIENQNKTTKDALGDHVKEDGNNTSDDQNSTNSETAQNIAKPFSCVIEWESNALSEHVNSTPDHRFKMSMSHDKKRKCKSMQEESVQGFGRKIFTNAIYEYIFPIIIGICLLATILLVFLLVRKLKLSTSEMNKSSCLLLITIAVADILTMCFAIAEIAYMFRESKGNNGLPPFHSCKLMLILERLSAIPHATSTWITVVIAVQRYLCVSRPFSARNYITVKSSCIFILVITSLSIALHACRFFDKTFEYITLLDSESNITTETCQDKYAAWISDPVLYESLFAWARICIAQFFPSMLIVSFVIAMVVCLRKVTSAAIHMRITDSRIYSDRRQLSLFVAAIAIIVFVVETSSGIFLSFNAWEISTGQRVIPYDSLKKASVTFDMLLYISYFTIFLIYCLMSEEIRKHFVLFCKRLRCSRIQRNKWTVPGIRFINANARLRTP